MVDGIMGAAPNQMTAPTSSVFDKSSENAKSGKSNQRDEETTTKIVIENSTVIVEQYDRHGKLIRKTPPGYLPPGENV